MERANNGTGASTALPPLRSFDDFAGSGARFDVPHFNDPKRFSNRASSNLLYYQTNYYLIYLALFAILLLMYVEEVVVGLLASVLLVGFDRVVCHILRSRLPQYERPLELTLDLLVMLLFRSALSGVFHVAFVFVVPTFPVVVHSCCRLRNVRNKLDRLVSNDTPMHKFLRLLNVKASESE